MVSSTRRFCGVGLAAMLVCLSLGRAQTTVFRVEGETAGDELGLSVEALGDANTDGIPDFAVSGYREDTGFVQVLSGADNSELFTVTSAFPNTPYGQDRNLTAIGDLDGDDITEIAVGTPWGHELEPLGFFDIHSGADGGYLTTHRGRRFESLGYEIARLGDVDGDSISDYAASTFEKGSQDGYVAIYSGKEQIEIGRLLTNEPVWFWSIAGPGDLNGDGLADIAIGLWSEEADWVPGQVRVLSGAIFTDPRLVSPSIHIDSETTQEFTLWTVDGKLGEEVHSGQEALGQGLNALGDINGDGVPDLGAGTGPADDAIILSGADGSRLHEWTSDRLLLDQFVVETEAIGDTNGDGFPDIVVGRRGSLSLHSGKDGKILATFTGEGGLGEEIAAVGDLDGDGLSEILAGAPEAGYALVISFALTPFSGLTLELQQDGMLKLWRGHGITDDWILESSTDLQGWTALKSATLGDSIILNREHLGSEAFFRWRAP